MSCDENLSGLNTRLATLAIHNERLPGKTVPSAAFDVSTSRFQDVSARLQRLPARLYLRDLALCLKMSCRRVQYYRERYSYLLRGPFGF